MRVDRGIADEDVDPAPFCARLRHQIFELRLIRYAGGDGDRLAAIGANGLERLLTGRLIARRDRHLGAGFGEELGDGPADAAPRTGDHRHLAAELEQGQRHRAHIPSRTSGLRKVPMPVISISHTSPCFRVRGAPSVPIQTTSPGYSVRYCDIRLMNFATPWIM